MRRLRTLFHPIFIFIGVQVAWLILMAIWISWYVKNNRRFSEFAERLNLGFFSTDFSWVVLLEGCFLMLVILAGVYFIFVYWNKQARLNRVQSNFVSSVTHELKSPLASIQLYLETMKYHKVSEKETQDFVEMMLADTERLSGLIENILQASKSDPKSMQMQFQPLEIGPVLKETLSHHQRQFEDKNCEIQLEVVDSPVLHIDLRAIRMVFNNLISNALRYSPSGSTLKVRIENIKKYCQISFTDQGIGIDKSDQKKIFRKFYRVQNPQTQNIEGAGLGLYISREIVKYHRGNLTMISEGAGSGSQFVISLPLGAAAREPSMSMFPEWLSR